MSSFVEKCNDSSEIQGGSVGGFKPFALERYFAVYEFSGAKLLCCSDCEPYSQSEVLAMADDETTSMWNNLSLGYTESAGLPMLREEIATSYDDKSIASSNVTVLCPEEGIYLSMRAIVSKGDEVIVTSPAYQSLIEVASAIEANVKKWEAYIDPENGDISFRVEDLFKLLTVKTKLVVINFPHNPTGYQLPRTDFELIIEKIKLMNNVYMFSDEMYRGLEYDEARRNPAVCQVFERGISLCGMSKVYAMPGLRIGWIVSQYEEFNVKLRTLKDYTTICPPAPCEILALIGLRNREKIIQRNLSIIKSSLVAVEKFMDRNSKIFQMTKPVAGSFAFPSIKDPNGSISALCKEWVEKGNVMLLPSNLYDFGDKHFRLGIGRKDCIETLQLWEEYIVNGNKNDGSGIPKNCIAKPNKFFCKRCKTYLFDVDQLIENDIHPVGDLCQSYFFSEPLEWMDGEEGKKTCPKCNIKIGTLKWSGSKCSCGRWVAPGIQIPYSRVDGKCVK
jgi:aspartate/methionine/tyrosine aminotransferase